MRVLNAAEVRAALPITEAIAAMRWAYIACSSGQAILPSRTQFGWPVGDSVSLIMPAFVGVCPESRPRYITAW